MAALRLRARVMVLVTVMVLATATVRVLVPPSLLALLVLLLFLVLLAPLAFVIVRASALVLRPARPEPCLLARRAGASSLPAPAATKLLATSLLVTEQPRPARLLACRHGPRAARMSARASRRRAPPPPSLLARRAGASSLPAPAATKLLATSLLVTEQPRPARLLACRHGPRAARMSARAYRRRAPPQPCARAAPALPPRAGPAPGCAARRSAGRPARARAARVRAATRRPAPRSRPPSLPPERGGARRRPLHCERCRGGSTGSLGLGSSLGLGLGSSLGLRSSLLL